MSETSQLPYPSHPGDLTSGTGPRLRPESLRASLLVILAVLAGSALVGLAGGFSWAALAPRVVYVVVSRGAADVVDPETTAFIAADGWYCLIGAVGGLIIGTAGYLFAVRRHGPVAMAGILVGSIGAGYVARQTGQQSGRAQFDSQLLTSHLGALLHAPLTLGGYTDLAFWPLAACLVAGVLVLLVTVREQRSRAQRRYAAEHRLGSPPQGPAL